MSVLLETARTNRDRDDSGCHVTVAIASMPRVDWGYTSRIVKRTHYNSWLNTFTGGFPARRCFRLIVQHLLLRIYAHLANSASSLRTLHLTQEHS
jgi:hypothetical protein